MTFDHRPEEHEHLMFNNDMIRWPSQHHDYNQQQQQQQQHQNPVELDMPLQAVVSSNNNNNNNNNSNNNISTPTTPSPATIIVPSSASTTATATTPTTTTSTTTTTTTTTTSLPTINTTNPLLAPPPPMLDPTKQYHSEWGVIKEQDFHPLTLKHQRDLENLYITGLAIADFYFWQANLGGYCMADMVQGIVVSSEGAFVLERKIVEGAPHPGRRKKKRGLGSN